MEHIYVSSGEWDDATTHRQLEKKYELVIELLEKAEAQVKKLEELYLDQDAWENVLKNQLAAQKRYEKAEAELAEVKAAYKKVIDEKCAVDESHCTCVPALRAELAELREQ